MHPLASRKFTLTVAGPAVFQVTVTKLFAAVPPAVTVPFAEMLQV